MINVRLTGEGDFGPVDLECTIPPARLPYVMAALFGAPPGGRGPVAMAATVAADDVSAPSFDGVGAGHSALAAKGAVRVADPVAFFAGFSGDFADLVLRMQPRGYAETILIAAIWLHYRDGRNAFARSDLHRQIRRQDHLRQPRNFSRDFQNAVARGYIAPLSDVDDGDFAVAQAGYQWFRDNCIK
ncbi:hypothetical protein [Thalassospira sp.]|uniref:hypothetical protein n=1 Tax=Thalassospira sp. TaxID=1912094 RepID=UPI0027344773|nr:hypothetical protein [Thalassospira sp.]MDP2698194.1 hypothetical protein [Thalassospira sp.]